MKLFGRLGIGCVLLSMAAGVAALGMKLGAGIDMTGNPLLMLCVLSTILGGQFFSLGLIGEVNARIYYSNQEKQPYKVRELVNFDASTEFDSSVKINRHAA